MGTNGTALAANYAVSPTQTVNLLQPGLCTTVRESTPSTFELPRSSTSVARERPYGLDLCNLFNDNPGLAFNQNFGDASLSSHAEADDHPESAIRADSTSRSTSKGGEAVKGGRSEEARRKGGTLGATSSAM